jgi:hypothetical protein
MNTASLFTSAFYLGVDRSLMSGQKKNDNSRTSVGLYAAAGSAGRNPLQSAPNSTAAFDQWLNDKLNVLYSPVLGEPIPEDLVELIKAHRQALKRD